jgi:tripartite-type tricarboxylate transporter receptor subunit TctC
LFRGARAHDLLYDWSILGRNATGDAMPIPRRRLLRLAAAGLLMPSLPHHAVALDYPTRPVRMVVGFPAGGSADIVARIVAQAMTERLGQTFIVDNKPGAGSNFGTEAVARARPDG